MTGIRIRGNDGNGVGGRGPSEDVVVAERYLAARFAAGTQARADGASASGRRWPLLEWASKGGRRLRGWLSALRLHAAPRAPMLSVAERLDLGPKKSLWVVACGGRLFLVAGGAETIAAMLEIGPAEEALRDRIPVVTPACWMAN